MTKPNLDITLSAPALPTIQIQGTWDAARRWINGIRKLDLGRRWAETMLGFELIELRKNAPHGNSIETKLGLSTSYSSKNETSLVYDFDSAVKTELGISRATAYRLMARAEAMTPTISEMTGLEDFNPLEVPLSQLPEAQQEQISNAIRTFTDGKGQMELDLELGLVKAPEPRNPGGLHPSAEKVEAWLQKHMPELAGTKWDKLKREVKNKIIADGLLKGKRLTPEAAARQAEEQRLDFCQQVQMAIAGKWLMVIGEPERADLKTLLQTLIDRINKMSKATR